eukprot:2698479-Lingulodinium_polyedra.AAC.1
MTDGSVPSGLRWRSPEVCPKRPARPRFHSFAKNEGECFVRAGVVFWQVLLAVASKSNEAIRFDIGARVLEVQRNQGYLLKGPSMCVG